jgi:uncharacterized metal-binding protein
VSIQQCTRKECVSGHLQHRDADKFIHIELYEQNEIKIISKSENSIIRGISHRDDQINAIVNTILTTTKWMIWKERNQICHFCIDVISRFTFGKTKYE